MWIVETGAAIAVAVVIWSAQPAAGMPTTLAQEAGRAEQTELLGQRLEEVRTRLNLTDEQVEQVRPILKAGFDAMLEVLQEHGINLRDRPASTGRLGFLQLRQLRRDLDGVRAQTIKDLDDMLTDAQLEVYKEIQEENRQAMRERLRQRR